MDELRKNVVMVFQRPNPFPTMNIYDNVLAGYILNGIKLKKSEKDGFFTALDLGSVWLARALAAKK